jgi:hypothetical protein
MKVTSAPDFTGWIKAKEEFGKSAPIPAGWVTVQMATQIFGTRYAQAGKTLRDMVSAGRAEVQPWKSGRTISNIYRLKK